MKIPVLLFALTLLALTACIDHSKKRTFSARTEALAPTDTSSGKEEQDTSAVSQNGEDNPLDITVKLTINDVDSTGGTIDITNNGAPYKRIASKGIEYPFTLDLNTYYLVKCSKKGYTTKVVYFDTHVPDGRQKQEFALFHMEVELQKEKKGEKTNSDKPVGGVRYETASGDFNKVTE